MGVGKSVIVNVQFNRSNSFYNTGEQISGIISLYTHYKKLILNKIFLEFIGEIGYTTEDTKNATIYHTVPFIQNRYLVFNSEDNEMILKRGQHSWPFEFTLPQSLPPSIDSYPYIKYYTRVVIDKPWYKANEKDIYPIRIYPNVDFFDEHGQEAICVSRRNRKYLQLKGSLLHRGILPGENISLKIDLENPNRLQIRRVEISIIQHRQIAQNQHTETIFQTELSDLRNFNGIQFHQNFDLQVPYDHLPPTHHYKTQYYDFFLCTDIRYELQLTLRVFGTLTEMYVNIPVIIGRESSLDRYQLSKYDCVKMRKTCTGDLEEINLPSSYRSIIENFKLKQLILTL